MMTIYKSTAGRTIIAVCIRFRTKMRLSTVCLWLVTVAAVEANVNSTQSNTYLRVSTEEPSQLCSNFRESKVDPQDSFHGRMERVRVVDHGWINGSVNYTATVPNWRLICPQQHYVATVLLRLSLSEEFALNMKHIQVAGCTDFPQSYFFNKKSIMVGVATIYNTTSTSPDWDMGYICIRHSMTRLAKQLLLYNKTMLYIKNNPGSYLTIARLLSHPETILEASDNQELQHILNLARESENQQHSEINTYSGSGSGS